MSKTVFVEHFTSYDRAINDGEGYSKFDNSEGKLAWAQSYLMESYLIMFEATYDKKWLDKFVEHAHRIANNTDRNRGIKDYKGRSSVGWSSLIYSPQYGWKKGDKIDPSTANKPWIMFWGHSGMIAYPLVKFGLLVRDQPALSEYSDHAASLLRVAEEAAAVFDRNWRFEASSGESYFLADQDEPARGGLKQPLDRDLSMGRVYLGLCKLNKGQLYCERAAALAKMFRQKLVRKDDHYVWSASHSSLDDMSHGAINVAFAYDAFQDSIVFTHDDMLRFCRTLANAYDGHQFSKFVDGSGEDDSVLTYSTSSARWLDLSAIDCAPYKVVCSFYQQYLEKKPAKLAPSALLGLSKLIKLWNQCSPSLR
jgi:hypothetical protein